MKNRLLNGLGKMLTETVLGIVWVYVMLVFFPPIMLAVYDSIIADNDGLFDFFKFANDKRAYAILVMFVLVILAEICKQAYQKQKDLILKELQTENANLQAKVNLHESSPGIYRKQWLHAVAPHFISEGEVAARDGNSRKLEEIRMVLDSTVRYAEEIE